jgi:hypothetical protein
MAASRYSSTFEATIMPGGFSAARLRRMNATMASHVARATWAAWSRS